MIVAYFLNRIYRYSLGLGLTKKNYLLDLSKIIFIKNYWANRQIFKIDFFLYSLMTFIYWSQFLQKLKLHLWLIIDAADLTILQFVFSTNFNFVCAQHWIPGLLSNTNLVLNGSRFLFAEKTNKIYITSLLNFAFFVVQKIPQYYQKWIHNSFHSLFYLII